MGTCCISFQLYLLLLCSAVSIYASNTILRSKNWEQILEGEWMVKFYAPWCPACRAVEGTWNELAEWSENEGEEISIASVDVTTEPGLNGRFMITALPTIYHIKDGVFRQYSGSRTLDDFKTFIKDQKWQEVSPMSSWMSPNSMLMSGMSKLFDFSIKLKDLHESLSKVYGVPGWASLLLMGLLLIIAGLLLGMVLVVATDYIWGPPQTPTYGQIKKQDIPVKDDPQEPTTEDVKEKEDEKKDKGIDAEVEKRENKE